VEKKLALEVEEFADTMNANFDDFEKEKRNKSFPCILTKFD